jgi:hypothetical protein
LTSSRCARYLHHRARAFLFLCFFVFLTPQMCFTKTNAPASFAETAALADDSNRHANSPHSARQLQAWQLLKRARVSAAAPRSHRGGSGLAVAPAWACGVCAAPSSSEPAAAGSARPRSAARRLGPASAFSLGSSWQNITSKPSTWKQERRIVSSSASLSDASLRREAAIQTHPRMSPEVWK